MYIIYVYLFYNIMYSWNCIGMACRFWYEQYMPKLLRACSIGMPGFAQDEESAANNKDVQGRLDAWFHGMKANGYFTHYGKDLMAEWSSLSVAHKVFLSLLASFEEKSFSSSIPDLIKVSFTLLFQCFVCLV